MSNIVHTFLPLIIVFLIIYTKHIFFTTHFKFSKFSYKQKSKSTADNECNLFREILYFMYCTRY